MAFVNFKRGTKPGDVSSLDANTIYFFTDTKEIYLGSEPYSGDISDLTEDISSLQSWMATHQVEYNGLSSALQQKLNSITASDNSVTIGGTDTEKTIKVAVSTTPGNALKLGEDGLEVVVPGATDYTVTVGVKDEPNEGVAKTYEIKQGESGQEQVVGTIDIPKDLVVTSGSIVNQNDEETPGTFIKLVLNNGDELYIDVADLVTAVSAGEQDGNPVQINVSGNSEITATLEEESITKNYLSSEVQDALDNAEELTTALTWGSLD